jgi:hypothetical protein
MNLWRAASPSPISGRQDDCRRDLAPGAAALFFLNFSNRFNKKSTQGDDRFVARSQMLPGPVLGSLETATGWL